MECREFRRMIDSYLSDELLVETNHDVLRHLENCGDCRSFLADCRGLRNRVRDAVMAMPELKAEPAFVTRLSVELKKAALRPSFWKSFSARPHIPAIGFACTILVILGAFLLLRSPLEPVTANANNQNDTLIEANKARLVEAVKVGWKELTEHAVGDHKNCAVKFNLAENPVSLDDAAKKFGAANKDIDKTIFAAAKDVFADQAQSRIKFLEAHSCIYNGRRFAHIVLQRQGKLISVLVADTDLPATADGPVNQQFDGTLNASGFQLEHHAVFVVSEMDAADNTLLARAILPAMRRHIAAAGA